MYCNYCGKVIQDDANVCAYCGKRIGSIESRHRLMRSRTDRKIAGVCAGFAEYFDLDVTLGARGVADRCAASSRRFVNRVCDCVDRYAGRAADAARVRGTTGCQHVSALNSKSVKSVNS